MSWLFKHRFLLLRRLSQLSIILLYFGANAWGWTILKGTLTGSLVFETVPLADPFMTLQLLSAGAVLGVDVLIGAVIITLFYALLGGRGFCSWVCPVNLVTDAANGLRRLFRIDEATYHREILSRNIRYWILVASLFLSAVLGVAAFESISPIGIMNRGLIFGFGFGFVVLLAIFLFDLLGVKNGFCGHICPLGGFYSLIGKMSLFRIHYDKEKCTKCMKCLDICPERPVLNMVGKHTDFVTMGACTLCARCVEVCDDDALRFRLRYLNQENHLTNSPPNS